MRTRFCLFPYGHGWDFKSSSTPLPFHRRLPERGDHAPSGAPVPLNVLKDCHLPRMCYLMQRDDVSTAVWHLGYVHGIAWIPEKRLGKWNNTCGLNYLPVKLNWSATPCLSAVFHLPSIWKQVKTFLGPETLFRNSKTVLLNCCMSRITLN